MTRRLPRASAGRRLAVVAEVVAGTVEQAVDAAEDASYVGRKVGTGAAAAGFAGLVFEQNGFNFFERLEQLAVELLNEKNSCDKDEDSHEDYAPGTAAAQLLGFFIGDGHGVAIDF